LLFNLYKLFRSLTQLEQLIVLGAAVIFIITGVVYGISLLDKTTTLRPAEGGTYREAVVNQPVYINPVISNANDADKDLVALIYSNVFALAEKITPSQNKLVWTIRLRDNLSWHDGVRLTADDVVFTIEKIQDPETRSPLFVTWQGVVPERVSELELTLTTGAPYAFFEDNLKNLGVIPKHLFTDVPVANWRLSNYNLEPVGSGPYLVDSYKKEKNGFISEYLLKRNDSYFGPRPYIDKIEFVYFTDESEAIAAFNNARVDAISGINPLSLSSIRRPHKLENLYLPRYYAVFLNQSSNELLKNKSVRLALGYATDKQRIVNEAFGGYAAIANGPIPPNQPSVANKNPSVNYNPEGAENNLIEAKLERGADGMRGEIKLVVPQIKFLTQTAEILKQNWEAVGIKTTIITLDPATVNNDVIRTRNYDAILFGNIFANNPDMFSFWHSSERFYPGLNLSLYNNKAADKLMENIRQNFSEADRLEDIAKLETTIIEDVPAVFLYSPNYLYITQNNISSLTNWKLNVPSNRFGKIGEWFINTKRAFLK